MIEKIDSVYRYILPDIFKEEEAYCKNYYLTHSDIDWKKPFYVNELDEFFLDKSAPFPKDSDWMAMELDSYGNFMSDRMLDYYHTDVYAMVAPNYFPPVIHYHTYLELRTKVRNLKVGQGFEELLCCA